jgi:predicted outer membrane repeat protein
MVSHYSFWLLLIAVIHCLVFPTAVNAELAFSVRPNSSVSCASPQQRPCLTFNEYAQQVDQYFVDNTTFLFLTGTHELDVQLDLEGLSNISFAPLDDPLEAQILLSSSVNITWTKCKNIEINGLIIILSGHFSVFTGTFLPSAELIFHNTSAVLASLTLTGNGTRLFAFTNVSSDVQIRNLMADGIRAPILYASESAITFYGHNTICNSNIDITVNIITILIWIPSLIRLDNGSSGYIRGNISFTQNNLHLRYTVNQDTSKFNLLLNSRVPGGGTAVSVSYNSMLVVCDTASFVRNRLSNSMRQTSLFHFPSGGALFAGRESKILFEKSSNISFVENFAEYGGGAISILNSNLIVDGEVLFKGNSAKYGGAIYILFFTQNNASIKLRNVWFERNTAILKGGTIYAENALISMTGTLHFVKNSAEMGGAIAFGHEFGPSAYSSSSKLLLIEPLMATFTENSASVSGGVIFFDDINAPIGYLCTNNYFQGKIDCFIEFELITVSSLATNNIRLKFNNNSAKIAGRIFYGGGLNKCSLTVTSGGSISNNDRSALTVIANDFSNVSISNNNNYKDNMTSIVSSDPLQVCICERDPFKLRCDSTDKVTVTVRGREFTLQAVTVGQALGAIPSDVRISLNGTTRLSSPAQRIQHTGKTCTNITYSLFSEESTTVMTLFPDNGPCRDVGIGSTQINVKFLPCPKGFNLIGSECICEERLRTLNAICNVSDSSIQWTSTSNRFWLGAFYENDSNESTYQGLILHSGCPFDYCVEIPVPITLDNLDIQCNHDHSGTLCGSCKEGYSIALGNLHCLSCSNDTLALILPFALAGIALVAVLLLLQLTVSAGTINGLIFYANIIQVNHSIFFPVGTTNTLTKMLNVFIAWLNLDFGIETCFYDGMTTNAYTWLQFVFPFYVWFLIGLIVVATHYSSKLTAILGKNPVAALATLFLLSYSKILGTIVGVVASTELEYPFNDSRIVWLFDGNVVFSQTQHRVLDIFAVLVLVFLFIPYTLLLFFAHWLQALSHWRIFSWLNKIKPFIDTYHAPYKKQTRYWTGLLLFVRILLFTVHAISRELTPIVITAITAVLLSMAWMHKGIYERCLNDLLEAFFLVNLCIFAAITDRNIGSFRQAEVGYCVIGAALIVFGCIILYHIYLRISNIKSLCRLMRREEKAGSPAPNADIINNDTDDCQQSLNRLDTSKFPPTQTFIHLREPLLEQ